MAAAAAHGGHRKGDGRPIGPPHPLPPTLQASVQPPRSALSWPLCSPTQPSTPLCTVHGPIRLCAAEPPSHRKWPVIYARRLSVYAPSFRCAQLCLCSVPPPLSPLSHLRPSVAFSLQLQGQGESRASMTETSSEYSYIAAVGCVEVASPPRTLHATTRNLHPHCAAAIPDRVLAESARPATGNCFVHHTPVAKHSVRQILTANCTMACG